MKTTFDSQNLMRFINFIKDTMDALEPMEDIEDVTINENGEIVLGISDCLIGEEGLKHVKERTVTFT